MTGAEHLAAQSLTSRIRTHTITHLGRIERSENKAGVLFALERAEGFVEGLEVSGALNPATIEALYLAVDAIATARLVLVKQ
ncbi:hypothetical protein ACEN2T_17270 [Pseudomonas sp. W22_MBD1_FP4]|uniref:hypothetical protein n=1 Tax=Pseudomonas sp. W22_MBD1_FP4 TaxID=3240272 RepID=UPI003F960435